MLRNRKIKRNWNNEDIALLIWLVSKRLELTRLAHFNELVTSNLFSKKLIGSLYQHWFQGRHGKSASSDGWALRRWSWLLINGQNNRKDFFERLLDQSIKLTGNSSQKNYMRKIHREAKYFVLPSNAGNIGIVFSILPSKKVLGPFKKTESYWNMSCSYKDQRNGQRFPSLCKAERKML